MERHIRSFPHVESHYCRANLTKNYLDPALSVSKMYQLYHQQETKNRNQPVQEWKYRDIFNHDFNLAFHKPKKDRCDRCEVYKIKKEHGQNTKSDDVDYASHRESATLTRE